MPATTVSALNPRTRSYEFLGPPGALAISLLVPATTYALYFACFPLAGGCPPPLATLPERAAHALASPQWWRSLWDWRAAGMYAAWYAYCVVAWAVLPGDWVEGVKLRTGEKLKYKINAFSTFLLTLGIVTGYIARFGPASFTFLYDMWVPFVSAAVAMSALQAAACYAASYRPGALLALGGNSGNPIYDFFIGRELNPRIPLLDLDVKAFNELRPGLILWVLVDISMACEQAARAGSWGGVTDAMWLVLAFQAWYVADGLYNEPAILTTMDITTDGFGFMLAAGDLAWVPFVYSTQARFLAFHPTTLGPTATAAVLLVNAAGYYVFRAANGEKNAFRNGRNPKNLTYVETENGARLLTSGWWGRSRHPNYFGDLLMALAWSLPTGFTTPVTYFYVLYFAVLLVHRQRRDDENCAKKYGKDWARYKAIVPYRIVPYVY